MSIRFAPNKPVATDLLKLGYQNIAALGKGICQLFDWNDPINDLVIGTAPFSFRSAGGISPDPAAQAAGRVSVVDNPVNPLEIVPKQYADSKVLISTDVTTTDGANYSGTTTTNAIDSSTGTYFTNLYVITNTGQANTGSVTLHFGTAPSVLVLNLDGTALDAGELITGMALLAFDGTAFRLISVQPDLGSIIGLPARTLLTAPVTLTQGTVTPILGATPAITTPSIGNWLLSVEYCIYMNIAINPSTTASCDTWVNDGTGRTWAPCRLVPFLGGPAGVQFMLSGSGLSPVAYPPLTGVDVQVQALTGIAGLSAVQAVVDSTNTNTLVPKSYISITMLRAR